MRRAKLVLKRPTKTLAPREAEVMMLLAYGNSRDEISLILSLSNTTVREYSERACRKLGAANTINAIAVAIVFGVIFPNKDAAH
jgi:DNA-binding CsgD family transcriptional regulator